MSIKIPTHERIGEWESNRRKIFTMTKAWERFWEDCYWRSDNEGPDANNFAKKCSEWKFVWIPTENAIEFENSEDAVMWVLHWT